MNTYYYGLCDKSSQLFMDDVCSTRTSMTPHEFQPTQVTSCPEAVCRILREQEDNRCVMSDGMKRLFPLMNIIKASHLIFLFFFLPVKEIVESYYCSIPELCYHKKMKLIKILSQDLCHSNRTQTHTHTEHLETQHLSLILPHVHYFP